MRRAAFLALILLAAFAARLASGLADRERLFQFGDSQAYRALGHSLIETGHLRLVDAAGRTRAADRMPGYPLVLAALEKLFGDLTVPLVVLQAAVGALAALLAWFLGRQVAGPLAAWTAAVLVAFSPWQVYFAALALTECWSAALLLATVLFALRALAADKLAWSAAAGLACAALIYFHPEFLALPLAYGIVALIARRRRPPSPAPAATSVLRHWALATAIVLVALLPWWIRNASVLGRFLPATTRLGVTLYDSFRPGATGGSDMRFEAALAADTKNLDESAYDAYYLRRTCQAVRADPAAAVALAAVKVARTWSPVPHAEVARRPLYFLLSAVAFLVMAVGTILALQALWRRRDALSLLLVPLAWVTMVHAVFVGSIRYRVPVEPLLLVLTGAAVAWLSRARKNKAGASEQ